MMHGVGGDPPDHCAPPKTCCAQWWFPQRIIIKKNPPYSVHHAIEEIEGAEGKANENKKWGHKGWRGDITMLRRVCRFYDKRCSWGNSSSSNERKKKTTTKHTTCIQVLHDDLQTPYSIFPIPFAHNHSKCINKSATRRESIPPAIQKKPKPIVSDIERCTHTS